jgi:ribosomal protein S18 acetylase RimI-like enzyme
MIEIRPLTSLTLADVELVAGEYVSDAYYRVSYTDTGESTLLRLDLVPLEQPVVRKYNHFNEEELQRYAGYFVEGFSFGAYTGEELVGFLIASAQDWNHSLWVWEFHVAATHRRQGIGRRLMECAAEKARASSLRVIVCETQNTNSSAIQAYRRLGFHVEAIDISYYTNQDYPDRDVAVFMKRRL